MKKHFSARFSAAVLAIGIYCLYSPYPCVIHAGEWTGETEASAALLESEISAVPTDIDVFFMESDASYIEGIRKAAKSCIAALGNSDAVVDDGTGCRVDTGFTGSYEIAQEVYLASKDEYYGNTGYSMDYIRLPSGDVHLFLKTEYGTPGQAYMEHLEAKARLEEIVASFSGSDEEKTEQIFQWACNHVSYADNTTVERIRETTLGCVPDYNGIYATTYTAVMNGVSTCDGFSGMLLALFELSGIPAAKVQNGRHAYNVAMSEGHWILYDAASGVSGKPGEFILRHGDYYAPKRLTCGYMAETVYCSSNGMPGTAAGVCTGQKNVPPAP